MNREEKFPAVVLAGGLADPETQAKYSIEYRAEMPIAGKKMVQYVIDALDKASHVGDICVVGNTKCEGVNRIIPAGGSMIDNLIAGINAYGNTGAVLVATADIPLLTPEAVDDFIERCVEHEADFYYPIISRELSEKRFPGMRRTYARIAEGTNTSDDGSPKEQDASRSTDWDKHPGARGDCPVRMGSSNKSRAPRADCRSDHAREGQSCRNSVPRNRCGCRQRRSGIFSGEGTPTTTLVNVSAR